MSCNITVNVIIRNSFRTIQCILYAREQIKLRRGVTFLISKIVPSGNLRLTLGDHKFSFTSYRMEPTFGRTFVISFILLPLSHLALISKSSSCPSPNFSPLRNDTNNFFWSIRFNNVTFSLTFTKHYEW